MDRRQERKSQTRKSHKLYGGGRSRRFARFGHKKQPNKAGGKIPKSETPGSDIRNLPKRSEIAAYKARNICGVLASRRAGQIRSFFVKKITVETTPTQAPWPPAGTQQQHPPTHKAQVQEQQESAPPLASSASLITDHSAASMRALSASWSTHGLGLLLDLLSSGAGRT